MLQSTRTLKQLMLAIAVVIVGLVRRTRLG